MKRELIKNSIYGMIQSVMTAILIYFVIPIFTNNLGSEKYGVFAVVSLIANPMIYLDIGISTSLIRFLAIQGRTMESQYDITVNFIMNLLISCTFAVMLMTFRDDIFSYLNIASPELRQDASYLLSFLLVANIFQYTGMTFRAVLEARQKLYITSMLQLCYSMGNWGLILVCLLTDCGLSYIGLATLIASVVWYVLVMAYAWSEWNGFTIIYSRKAYVSSIKKQLSYGLKLYASSLISMLNEPLVLLLASHMLGLTATGILDIALKIKRQCFGVIGKMLYSLYPALAECQDADKVRFLIHDLSQKSIILMIPVSVLILFITAPMVTLWFSRENPVLSDAVMIVGIFYLLFVVPVIPVYYYLLAKGFVVKSIYLQIAMVITNIAVIVLTASSLGFYSLLLGNSLAVVSGFSLSLYYQHRYTDNWIFKNIVQFLKVILSLAAIISAGMILSGLMKDPLTKLLLLPFMLGVITLLLYRKLQIFSSEDIGRYFPAETFAYKVGKKILLQK